jgi:signal transduction histidine kinase
MDVLVEARERADTAFLRGVLQGLVVFRWLALGYATIGVIVSDEHLLHSSQAVGLLALAFAFTVAATWLLRTDIGALTHPVTIAIEFGIGIVLLVGDGWVYADARPQSLPWAWPAASLISAGLTYGVQVGVVLALGMGVASFIGEGLNSGGGVWGVAASSKTALYVLSAAVAGYVARRLRYAEQQVSVARAREEVARTLHDGVLQTLAVIQRRSDDPELVQLAREQDAELRGFLFGTGVDAADLAIALRDLGARTERHHGLATRIVVADDLPHLKPDRVRALTGAVTEAINTVKHAEASRVVVYVEPDPAGGVFCSVKDDGRGFGDPVPHEGQGIRRSIRDRVEEVGGRVEISSRPDRGTEVRLWVQ